VNGCQLSALEALPGIGRKRAIRLFRARPICKESELTDALEDPGISKNIRAFLGELDGE
jgi:hypothetical protein